MYMSCEYSKLSNMSVNFRGVVQKNLGSSHHADFWIAAYYDVVVPFLCVLQLTRALVVVGSATGLV